MSFAAIAGPVAGAVVGGLMSDGGGGQQTATKEPWEPARKPLINSLNTGQDLERYYQQNPFNILQQQGYQNLFSDLDQFRTQAAPGLMDFANRLMTSNYQRGPRNSQLEAIPQSLGLMQAPQMGSTRPQMMTQGPDGSYSPQMTPPGLLSAPGPFQAPSQGRYGLLDSARFRDELNPFTSTNGIPPAPGPAAPAPVNADEKPYDWRDDYERILRGGMNYTGAGA